MDAGSRLSQLVFQRDHGRPGLVAWTHRAETSEDDRVVLKTVKIARDLAREVEIAAGLAADDKVIITPTRWDPWVVSRSPGGPATRTCVPCSVWQDASLRCSAAPAGGPRIHQGEGHPSGTRLSRWWLTTGLGALRAAAIVTCIG